MILIACTLITTDERNVLCTYEWCIFCSVPILTDCTYEYFLYDYAIFVLVWINRMQMNEWTCMFLNIYTLLLPHNLHFLSALWKVLTITTFLKISPFQEHHWPIISKPNLFSPFFSFSLQKKYSLTAPEMLICVWVKHPVEKLFTYAV
jgi:hypothetical protein